jgi:hypothetical protein
MLDDAVCAGQAVSGQTTIISYKRWERQLEIQ